MHARLVRRGGVALLLASFCAVSALPCAAEIIPSKAADPAPIASRETDLAQVKAFMARDEVAKALSSRGLSPDEVSARLAQLSPQDLRALAADVNQIQAAGNVPNYIWIILAVFLVVSTLAIIF
jgi:hypothetical protein